MQKHSGGDSVALGIILHPITSWDLGPRQYLYGDSSALRTFNQPTTKQQHHQQQQ